MLKKIVILAVGLILILFLSNVQKQTFLSLSSNTELLRQSFEETGAKYKYSNINSWAKINDNFDSLEDLNKYAKSVINSLNINEKNIKISKIEEDNFRQIDVEYTDKNKKQISIAVQSLKNTNKSETYMLIDEYLLDSYYNISEEKNSIDNVFKDFKLKPKNSICFVGTFDGILNNERKSSIVKLIMDNLNAKEIESIKEDNILSVSAFSNKIKEYIEFGSEKINLNIAIRYSSFDNKTYIWVATPIISMEY